MFRILQGIIFHGVEILLIYIKIPNLSLCIMCVQYIEDTMSTLGDTMSTLGDIMSTLGDIMSTSTDVWYIGRYHDARGEAS